ncbi:MAG: bifunctional DNA-formamidopyrimidine glycosylase/DNA-(apurinic or apyrimidinic site) lyase [candidate division WOR-3 bacterium]
MPELPEIETIRRRLEPQLTGKRIINVRIKRADIVGHPTVQRLIKGVIGRRITGLSRRGKYLILNLTGQGKLIFHLRLSGALFVVEDSKEVKFERLRFGLDDGKALSFSEPRVLGRVYLIEGNNYPAVLCGMLRMGLEPIEPSFSAKYLQEKLQSRKARVKTLLLDQRVCCGVGNIYSDEALFRAGIRPLRRANSLTAREIARLAQALRSVLKQGIKWCGTTMDDWRYLLPDGSAGGFQNYLAVFGKAGTACRRCGSTIRRVRISNRYSSYCPECQR